MTTTTAITDYIGWRMNDDKNFYYRHLQTTYSILLTSTTLNLLDLLNLLASTPTTKY